MQLTTALAFAFGAGTFAAPVVSEDKSNYQVRGPLIEKGKFDILRPIKGSGDINHRPPPGGYRDLKLKKDLTLAWKNG
jgi:hypothetical protein